MNSPRTVQLDALAGGRVTMPPTGLSVALDFLRSRLLVPLALTFFAAFFHLIPATAHVLEFNRTALAEGQLWRLFTGHFVHFSFDHFIWDAAALLVLGALLPPQRSRHWLLLLGGSALAISAGVWLWQPQFEIYRGLSGLDCALFGAVLVYFFRAARRDRDRVLALVTGLAFAGFAAKTGYELVTQRTVFVTTATSFVPVPLAHFIGLLCGATFSITAR